MRTGDFVATTLVRGVAGSWKMRTGDFVVQLYYAAESSLFCILQNA